VLLKELDKLDNLENGTLNQEKISIPSLLTNIAMKELPELFIELSNQLLLNSLMDSKKTMLYKEVLPWKIFYYSKTENLEDVLFSKTS